MGFPGGLWLRRAALCLAVLALLAPVLTAQEAPDRQQDAERLVRSLGHRYFDVRERARLRLRAMGPGAQPALLAGLNAPDPAVRAGAAALLGERRVREAIPGILDLLLEAEPSVRGTAAQALGEYGNSVRGALLRFREEHPESADLVADLLPELLPADVERILDGLISPPPWNGWGYYQGQFDELVELGPEIETLLLDIFLNDEHSLRHPVESADRMAALRDLAGQALGQVGGERTRTVFRSLLENGIPGESAERTRRVLLTGLWFLADQEPLESEIRTLRQVAEGESSNLILGNQLEAVSALCHYLYRVGRPEESLRYYEKYESVLTVRYQASGIAYNMACTYARVGRKDKALAYLRRAVDLGYADIGWILLDRDLDPIRAEPQFQQILEKPREFWESRAGEGDGSE